MNNYGKEGLKEGEENNGGRKGEVEGVVGLQNWYLKCKQQSICELYGKIWVCLGDACSYRNISLSYLLKRAFEKSEEGSSVNKFYKNSSCEWKKKKTTLSLWQRMNTLKSVYSEINGAFK